MTATALQTIGAEAAELGSQTWAVLSRALPGRKCQAGLQLMVAASFSAQVGGYFRKTKQNPNLSGQTVMWPIQRLNRQPRNSPVSTTRSGLCAKSPYSHLMLCSVSASHLPVTQRKPGAKISPSEERPTPQTTSQQGLLSRQASAWPQPHASLELVAMCLCSVVSGR